MQDNENKKTQPCQIHVNPEYVEPIQNVLLDVMRELLNDPSGRLRAALKKEYADERQFEEAVLDAIRSFKEESDGRRPKRKTGSMRPKSKPTSTGD